MSIENKPSADHCQDAENCTKDDEHENKEAIKKVEKKLITTYLMNKFEFISKHIGTLTALTTFALAAITAISKFLRYVFEAGKVNQLNIPKSEISIFSDYLLYDIVLTAALGCFVFMVLAIPYFVFKSRCTIIKKIGIIGISFLLFSIVFSALADLNGYISFYIINRKIVELGTIIIALIISYLIVSIAPCVFFYHVQHFERKKKGNKLRISVLLVIIVCYIIVLVGFTYRSGQNAAKSNIDYRVITEQSGNVIYETSNDRYAIIYENEKIYYLAKCETEDNRIINIYFDHQKTISKENVEYIWMVKSKQRR